MDTAQRSLKRTAQVAIVAMSALFITGIIFYKERVLFADASFFVFNIINSKKMAIQELSLGSFIKQVVRYFGQVFHLPLSAILVLYGMSFNLFFLTVCAMRLCGFRQY